MTEEIINSDGSRNWQANILLDNVKRLEQENRELKAYKDVNEDFKKAWDELNKKYTEVLKLAKENADSNEYCLQELEQENKELKVVKEQLKKWNDENLKRQDDMQLWIDLAEEQRNKYRSALEEIREMILYCEDEYNCDRCKYHDNCLVDDDKFPDFSKALVNKINEVLK